MLGQEFSFAVLQAMGDRAEDVVESALEAGERAGLVRPLDADTYAFDHALTQHALLVELSPWRRRRLHRAAGAALEHVGAATTQPAAAAWHFQHGESPERALPYALLAGDQAATMFAHAEAATHYRVAADLAKRCGDAGQEAVALERLGGVLKAAGQLDDALATCEEASTRYSARGDLEGEGRATSILAESRHMRRYGKMPDDTTAILNGQPRQHEYKSDSKPTGCPGCGDFGVLNARYGALRQKGYSPKDVVSVSGIGCSSRLPFFVTSYGFHGLHGRAMPIATGLKAANPDLTVLVFGGDGDAFAIGGDHFMHACRRNVDVTYVVMDNATYGLTKGQASPTSRAGYVTKTTPSGTAEQPVNPLALALVCGATYVAQGFSARPKHLTDLIVQGIEHRGFAFIEALSPCPTFNKLDTFGYYKENIVDVPPDHDPSDLGAALRLAAGDQIHAGLVYQRAGQVFGESRRQQPAMASMGREEVLARLFTRFS